ncbi:hypothetical protein [Absidia glauca]|uniref:Uncharacterized protein n=1 Tax=Absidia glauca TaxID=4829 RepID=A0A168PRX8_ABSGL|nr:hypothetical protein [Absidia glauca]
MSTLKTFGFNVRRKRNQESASPLIAKQDKAITHESIPSTTLAFEAPSIDPPSKLSPSPSTQSNSISTSNKIQKSKPATKRKTSPKDPKQATLLPFFSSPRTNTLLPQSPQAPLIPPPPPSSRQQITAVNQAGLDIKREEGNEVCQIRRRISVVELLPLLVKDYCNEHSSDDDDNDSHLEDGQRDKCHAPTVLLQVKPSKAIYAPEQATMISGQNTHRRRRRSEEDGQEDHPLTHPSLSLSVVTKRLCSEESHHHTYSFLDDFDSQEDNVVDDATVRNCLSTHQVNSLLLAIANEYMAFDDNGWCSSYLD